MGTCLELKTVQTGTRSQFRLRRLPLMGDVKYEALLRAEKAFWTTVFLLSMGILTAIDPDQCT